MLTYLEGDATCPVGGGVKIVAHVCNDMRKWGRGFVLAVRDRWPSAERAYLDWGKPPIALGSCQIVLVKWDPDGPEEEVLKESVWVANMTGQHDNVAKDGIAPIRYEALETALTSVAKHARYFDASIHMPRIGCGLAGGSWDQVGPIVERTLRGLDVYVYHFSDTKSRSFVPAR